MPDDKTYHICLACNEKFLPHAAAVIASIMDHRLVGEKYVVYLFGDSLTAASKAKILSMQTGLPLEIKIVDLSDEMFREMPKFHGNYVTYFRLVIDRFLPGDVRRVLYLDSDVVVCTNLAPLFATDLSNRCAAVVAEKAVSTFIPRDFHYFNAGMIFFNLDEFRRDGIGDKTVKMGITNKERLHCHDQDLLNEVFDGKVVFLPLAWNMTVSPQLLDVPEFAVDIRSVYSDDEIAEAMKHPKIIHYLRPKPWIPGLRIGSHPHTALYWKYLKKTPFYTRVRRQYRFAYPVKLVEKILRSILAPFRSTR